MKMSVAELKGFVGKQFEYQRPMLSLWQTLANNFYPERADFTITRNVGNEIADGLLNSYPIMVRRDLANSLGSLLRDGDWFKLGINGDPDHSGQSWLDWSSKRLKRIMYDQQSNFTRTTSEADKDYITFGQPVISIEPNRKANGLLYRCWHLRDCAWWDDENGQVCGVARKWKPMLWQLREVFGVDKLHNNMSKDLQKNLLKEADIYHIVIPSVMYGLDTQFPYVSIYLDVKNEHLIEEVPTNNKHYIIPRFQTIAGSAYAFSPATIVGLPDARMLQAMTHTLMEAGERYARPPMLAKLKAVRGDVNLMSDGITYIDEKHDVRLGAALQPISQDRGGFPIGLEMRDGIVETLSSIFYLNKLSLPEVGRDMTAYEIQERMKIYRREVMPLIAPTNSEYSGQLCEESFRLAMAMGMMGSPKDIPQSLQEKEVIFKFVSPLTETEDEKKSTQFNMVSQMLADAVSLDEGVSQNINFDEAFRDAVTGIGAPQKWLNSVDDVLAVRQQVAQEQMMAATQEG